MKRIVCNAIATVLFVGSGIIIPASAQSQASSTPQSGSSTAGSSSATAPGQALGDYARQVRKTSGPPSKPKVFDNDNLPTEDKLSVIGTARDASADAPAAP